MPMKPKPKYVQLIRPPPEEHPDIPKTPLINIISRDDWDAVPPKSTAPMELPVNHLRYNQTNTEICMKKEDCAPLLQKLQKEHMDRGLPDIQYHFMIGGDGTVYEGRGWETKGETHAALEGKTYYDVAYIGNFGKEGPNWEQSVTGQRFVKYAIENKSMKRSHGITFLCDVSD